jgi:hypothetical protein
MPESLVPAESARNENRAFRSVLLAAGMVVGVALIWFIVHREREQPWNGQAITARFVDISMAKGKTDVHLVLKYALTNGSGHTYRMPKPTYGELMRRLPDGTMKEVDSVEWDQGTTVPAPGMAEVQLDIALDPLHYHIDMEDLEKHDQLVEFEKERLSEMRGLVLLDYTHHYRIELPRGWQ